MASIDFYTFGTPNGRKVEILIEELQIPHRKLIIDIEKGQQKLPSFLALNPNGKIPVIVDHSTGRTIFESCAILLYLADKYGSLGPADDAERLEMQQWLFFQVGHIGPMIGQYWHFTKFADTHIPEAIARYGKECTRLLSVLESHLSTRPYVNREYSISDIAIWPWIDAAVELLGFSLDPFPNLKSWHSRISARPAVKNPSLHNSEADKTSLPVASADRS